MSWLRTVSPRRARSPGQLSPATAHHQFPRTGCVPGQRAQTARHPRRPGRAWIWPSGWRWQALRRPRARPRLRKWRQAVLVVRALRSGGQRLILHLGHLPSLGCALYPGCGRSLFRAGAPPAATVLRHSGNYPPSLARGEPLRARLSLFGGATPQRAVSSLFIATLARPGCQRRMPRPPPLQPPPNPRPGAEPPRHPPAPGCE